MYGAQPNDRMGQSGEGTPCPPTRSHQVPLGTDHRRATVVGQEPGLNPLLAGSMLLFTIATWLFTWCYVGIDRFSELTEEGRWSPMKLLQLGGTSAIATLGAVAGNMAAAS
jgi:hypothetical protein